MTRRDAQRAASEAAILDAAWAAFARTGPDGTSLRDVARQAGCTHALVVRYFGSKDGLTAAVADRLHERVATAVERAGAADGDPLVGLLAAARRDRPATQLLVRSALGDLHPVGFPACLPVARMLPLTIEVAGLGRRVPDRRTRLCAYAATSLLLGWVTFEGFLVAATRLGRMAPGRRDAAVAATARDVLRLAGAPAPRLGRRDLATRAARRRAAGSAAPAPAATVPVASRDALLAAAIELFAAHGPASVSVRDVARRAGVNQGLIYRHFGSKEALLAEAIEQGSSGLFPAALAAEGFDFDAMSHLLHHGSPAPRLIARTLVDDVDIRVVRRQYPVLRRLLADLERAGAGSGGRDGSDARVAVSATAALALGSVIWGPHLRPALGLPDGSTDAPVADLARHLIAGAAGATATTATAPPTARPDRGARP